MSSAASSLVAHTLTTPWGESLDPQNVLADYPRPQLVRESYLTLNGYWQYAITATDARPTAWHGQILVPFSPEAPLSGVNRQLLPGETLWYRRTVTLPSGFLHDRLLLHFGAVDQRCRVYLGETLLGNHEGGYLPFTLELDPALFDAAGNAELTVAVRDDSDTDSHSRGKQRLKRGGIWYTAQSGIWQSVWLESVPSSFVQRLTITPLREEGCVEITVHCSDSGSGSGSADISVAVAAEGTTVASAAGPAGHPLRLPLPGARDWSPEDPFLYDVTVSLGSDTVTSYFGMRSFGMGPDAEGIPRLLLNGEPYFHAGVLDQGYWPDGLYTAPSDEAMIYDIQTMKDLGFTMLRKHIKIEPLRWYYHCDRLGMLVWQDAVNGGTTYNPAVITLPAVTPLRLNDHHYRAFGRADARGREQFHRELRDTIELLYNVPSIAAWVPFNEGWGQFDALRTAEFVRRLDPSRSIDHASGWHDQGGGDLRSLHVYFRPFRAPRRRDIDGAERALVLSEYGGYSLRLPGHEFGRREFGYKRFTEAEAFAAAVTSLHDEQIAPAIGQGLSATVYTQLSDVEDEINGLLSYDRRVLKMPADAIRTITAQLRLS